MVFSRNRELNKSEIELVKNVLEKFPGRGETFCRSYAEKNDYVFLDQWNDKMGFVKETQNKYLILSLHFEENKCDFYQLIIKGEGDKWTDSKIIDYDIVREAGIIHNT